MCAIAQHRVRVRKKSGDRLTHARQAPLIRNAKSLGKIGERHVPRQAWDHPTRLPAPIDEPLVSPHLNPSGFALIAATAVARESSIGHKLALKTVMIAFRNLLKEFPPKSIVEYCTHFIYINQVDNSPTGNLEGVSSVQPPNFHRESHFPQDQGCRSKPPIGCSPRACSARQHTPSAQ